MVEVSDDEEVVSSVMAVDDDFLFLSALYLLVCAVAMALYDISVV